MTKYWVRSIVVMVAAGLISFLCVDVIVVPRLIAHGVEVGTIWGWAGVLLAIISIGVTVAVAKLVYELQKASGTRDTRILRKIGGDDGTGGLLKDVGDIQAEVRDVQRSQALILDEVRVVVTDIQEIVAAMAAEAREQANRAAEGLDTAVSEAHVMTTGPGEQPPNADDLLARVHDAGGAINNPHWTRKRRCNPSQQGNYGWFVEDAETKERWFVHKGHGVKARRAIPRAYLKAWEEETGRRPCEVRLDYRIGSGKGNHSWFIETYGEDGGETWRISSGGQGKNGHTVAIVEYD